MFHIFMGEAGNQKQLECIMTDNHTAADHLSEAKLKFLMRDKRYWHPRHADPAFQAMITSGFRRLYPTPGQAHDAATDETSNGPVHVDAHKRSGIPVSDYYRSRPGQADAPTPSTTKHKQRKHLPPPDRDDITPEELYDILDFDPNGAGKYQVGIKHPAYATIAPQILTPRAHSITKEEYGSAIAKDDEADAFRHAYISFEMTKNFGPEVAKAFGDAHEISHPNNGPERMMDLYNNYIGRQLASDEANKKRSTRDVVRQAIQEGRLRLKPYTLSQKKSPQ